MNAQVKWTEILSEEPSVAERIGELEADPYVLASLLFSSPAIAWGEKNRGGWRAFEAFRDRDWPELGRIIGEQLRRDIEQLAKDQLSDEEAA